MYMTTSDLNWKTAYLKQRKLLRHHRRQQKLVRFIVMIAMISVCFSFFAVVQVYGSKPVMFSNEPQSVSGHQFSNGVNVSGGAIAVDSKVSGPFTANDSASNTNIYESYGNKHPNIVEVNRGDTLWKIASIHKGNRTDIRTYVFQMMKLNGLKNGIVQEGQLLTLPAGSK